MNLDDVAEALAEKLDQIPGLRAFAEVPQKITPPAAIVSLGEGTYDTFGAPLITATFKVLVVVSAANARSSQKALRQYCSAEGTYSVREAIEADGDSLELAGVAVSSTPRVEGWAEPESVTIAGTEYVGLEFAVTVVE